MVGPGDELKPQSAVVAALAEAPGGDAVEQFLRQHAFPLSEGRLTTFVFNGNVERVMLVHWIQGLPPQIPLRRVDATNVWYLSLELPPESRIEYKFLVEDQGQTKLVRDQLNPSFATDPFGANSVCQTAGYEVPDWTLVDERSRPGELHEIEIPSTALGGPRRSIVYLPARFRPTRRYPLLVVHDGPDYLRFAALKTVLDNLTYRLEIPPMVVAMMEPHKRLVEYANHRPHAEYVVEELLPYLEKYFPISPSPRKRALMGASFGAVASLSTAWHYPGRFGGLLLQSGSFAFTDVGEHDRGPIFDPVVKFMNAYRAAPRKVSQSTFISCGVFERNIYDNRSLVPVMQESGMAVRYVEARDGHNWENWRDRLREGLSWLFPGPLWFVYE